MMNQYNNHNSVLLIESIDSLNIKSSRGVYIDCTAGRGGHIDELLKRNNENLIIGIDKDLDAINFLKEKYCNFKNVHIIHNDFKNIDSILKNMEIKKVDGFLFDLGVSSPQLDNPKRGFSYRFDSFLDMRMDQTQKKTAFDVVNNYSLDELTSIFRKYGEIKNAYKVANQIVKHREKSKIETTNELVEILKEVNNKHEKKHPARLVFQALRIEVNNELDELEETIIKCFNYLNDEGVISIISFHSLEDKIVKNTFNKILNLNSLPSYIPIVSKNNNCYTRIIKPNKEETINNNRSRSAKLRVLIKKGV